ncbi:MAG: glycosyltransferase family 39 protein [Acidobacteria bacterium]|nr:glycosyltransferase family 39 protein [Acidobacteriota bacterium]
MTKMESLVRFSRSPVFRTGFFLLAVVVFFFGLTVPLLGPDEPRYSQVAREMFMRSDWVTPTLGGFHWFEKPALLYWLQIASYNLFGVNEFAARFGSALFGLGTALCLLFIGRTVRESDSEGSTIELGQWLAMLAVSTLGILVFARGASFDIILTFPLTASLVGYFIADRSEENSRRAYPGLLAFYVFMGIAVIAKGLVGIVFPFAIVGFYHVLSRRFPAKRVLLSVVWGVPVAVAAASLWYLPMYLRHGWEFIDEFFVQHHFQRYTSNKYQHPQPFHFFFWVLPLMTLPWLPFFAVGVWRAVRDIISGITSGRTDDGTDAGARSLKPLMTFAFAWMAVPLVFFSFSGSKLPGYILPSVPAAIILAGIAARQFALCSPAREVGIKITAVAMLVIVLGILQFALPGFADNDSVKKLAAAAESRGFAEKRVAGFLTINHNAEFYFSGRLFRTKEGRQRKLNGPADIPPLLRENGSEPVLLILRQEHIQHLNKDPEAVSEVLETAGEYALAIARPR